MAPSIFGGLAIGFLDAPRPGARRKITDGDVKRVLRKTVEERPAEADATHWSTRTMQPGHPVASPDPLSRVQITFAPPRDVTVVTTAGNSLAVPDVAAIEGRVVATAGDTLLLVVEELTDARGMGLKRAMTLVDPTKEHTTVVSGDGTRARKGRVTVTRDADTLVRRYESRFSPFRTLGLMFAIAGVIAVYKAATGPVQFNRPLFPNGIPLIDRRYH